MLTPHFRDAHTKKADTLMQEKKVCGSEKQLKKNECKWITLGSLSHFPEGFKGRWVTKYWYLFRAAFW